jgi:hypothetical protein
MGKRRGRDVPRECVPVAVTSIAPSSASPPHPPRMIRSSARPDATAWIESSPPSAGTGSAQPDGELETIHMEKNWEPPP